MEIIAKTNAGFLITATESELKAIFSAVSRKDGKIEIGDKIPAYDYSAVIEKFKAAKTSFYFREMKEKTKQFTEEVTEYVKAIETLKFEE